MIINQSMAFLTIYRKEIKRIFRIWIQTLIPPLITSSLYFVIFGFIIGARMPNLQDHNYMQFLAPGFIMMNLIISSYTHTVSAFYMQRFSRSIEEILVSSTSIQVMLWAFVCAGMTRGLISAGLVTLVSLYFTQMPMPHPVFLITFALLASLFFSLAGFLNSLYARDFNDTAIVPTFLLTPFIYLGGVFYSLSMLPAPWKVIAQINPILYIINGFRYGCIGYSDVSIALALWILTVSIVALALITSVLLHRGHGIRT